MEFDAVVAVGGDGTVNEVAQGLRDTGVALGILPQGSGNGFARHLHIPVNTARAIQLLNHSEPIRCDYGLANGRLFVSTCGTGFDALIADQFAGSTRRGFKTYFQNVVKDLLSYKSQNYHIVGDDLDITHRAFLIAFANASQWGYEAYIAPQASIQDGKMDICMMSSSALLGAPGLALRLFTKSIDNSLFMDTVRAREVMLYREEDGPFHIDGEPVNIGKDMWLRRQCTKYNGTSYIAQRAALATYTPEGKAGIRANLDFYQGTARLIKQSLQNIGYEAYGGENAPYIWCHAPHGWDSWTFFNHLLQECQILCTPGVGFGASGEGYVRLSAFSKREDCEEALKRIQSIM